MTRILSAARNFKILQERIQSRTLATAAGLSGGRRHSSSLDDRCCSSNTCTTNYHSNQTYSQLHSNSRAQSYSNALYTNSHSYSHSHGHARQMTTKTAKFTYTPSMQSKYPTEIHRLNHLRNVGVFAHVDAGKTTVTERMLALAGVVHHAGSVDSGNTVTDFLPAERERGITIQSAAISFEWQWHNSDDIDANGNNNANNNSNGNGDDQQVTIHLIDTPGHVDFSVEVNRSVAVLDGAVLVVDAVAGVQAQTETVWRAMTRPSLSLNNSNHETGRGRDAHGHGHEPLPCLAFVNKMDKEGCNFGYAISTLRYKLPGANPVAIQVPLFEVGKTPSDADTETETDTDAGTVLARNIVAVPASDLTMSTLSNGKFVGVVDLLEMRAIVWPEIGSAGVSDVEECIPSLYNLLIDNPESQVTKVALAARQDLVTSLADVDDIMEELFLMEEDPSNRELRSALRRATLDRKILPVMTGAALRGKGVEPLLDAMADLLPSPLQRQPPALLDQEDLAVSTKKSRGRGRDRDRSANKKNGKMLNGKVGDGDGNSDTETDSESQSELIKLGHPLHPSLLALAFKVVHMKNKGGSGDGRVVFARVYSGKISSKDTVRVISPVIPGEIPQKPRTERVGGMLELAGGRFDNLKDAVCYSGDVCALIGLKSVATGDTILLASNDGKGSKKNRKTSEMDTEFEISSGYECLAGVGAPKPVLTVRVEAENAEQESKLLEALTLLVAEDPSLLVEETGSATLISGLGELHIEVVVDRLQREYGLAVWIGKPSVAYRETVLEVIETPGLVDYDRTVGSTRMQAWVHLRLEPVDCPEARTSGDCMILSDPIVTLGPKVRDFLGFDDEYDESELAQRCDIAKALISGCKGALKRGPMGSYEIANVRCHVEEIDADGGIASLKALPGAIRAASSTILTATLNANKGSCSVLEPTMRVEISAPSEMVGTVLSDLTTRRGTVGEVIMGDDDALHTKALIHGQVPLAEILGYANNLRSITGGEGAFSAEYKGHSACDH